MLCSNGRYVLPSQGRISIMTAGGDRICAGLHGKPPLDVLKKWVLNGAAPAAPVPHRLDPAAG